MPWGKRKIFVDRNRERGRGERMHLFFQDKWEVEGLQTVGILLVVCSSLKLMHFLGLIDLSTAGKRNGKRARERRQVRSQNDEYGEGTLGGIHSDGKGSVYICISVFIMFKHNKVVCPDFLIK